MRTLPILALVGGLAIAGCAAPSDDGTPNGESPPSTQDVMANLSRTVGIAHEKMVSLARAMPEDRWEWRPMEGVRSVAEIYQHVAADNWFGPALMGVMPPADVGVTGDAETVDAYQARAMSRDEIVAELERSFVYLEGALAQAGPRADEEVRLRGNPLTQADLSVRLIVHLHEHLGQAIAYARANGVVPPWSR